uniref:Transposase (Putative), gypsy type n=1 Tax=Tanacetum cinerariifolium TaxID=118510 RepID=A0A699HGF4_TANCI|nr:hypothetical protein [Tanacetum cinerariifolium]
MYEKDQTVDVTALPKFDMPSYESKMTAEDVKSLSLRHVFRVLGDKGAFFCLPIGRYQAFSCTYFSDCAVRIEAIDYVRAILSEPEYRSFCKFIPRFLQDINDPVLEDGFSMQDVEALTERVIDLRTVPSGLLFQGGLATTWDYPGFCPIFKDTEGNVVTMSEYLCFPFLSGASISKGPALTSQDRIPQHTTCPLPEGQDILEKTDHQRRVEVEDPKIVATKERKARVAAKKRERKKQGGDGGEGSRPKTKRWKTTGRRDGLVASKATSSPEPLRTLNPHQPSGALAATAESRENCSPPASPRDSANCSSERALTLVNTEVIQPSPACQRANQGPTTDRVVTPLRTATQGANTEEGESSREGALYVPGWSILHRCHMDNPMWCRELMFSLARGSISHTDILKRFENLQTDFKKLAESHAECGDLSGKLVQARLDLTHNTHLYTSLFDRYKALKNEHEGCAGKLEGLENRKRELSQANMDRVLRIKELKAALAQKDSALVYGERINAEQAQEKKRLVSQVGKAEMENFDCIRKLLPTMVERLLQSHEYKLSLSKPFNLDIQAGWGKGLAEEKSKEDLLELMGRMEGFDVHADTRMRVEYDKLFERRYPYVDKISYGFLHSVSDLLKVYPDSPPREQVSPLKPSSEKAPATSAPPGS